MQAGVVGGNTPGNPRMHRTDGLRSAMAIAPIDRFHYALTLQERRTRMLTSRGTDTELPANEGFPREAPSFVADGGDMGALIRSIEWERTPLGPLPQWPQSLRTAVSIMLQSRFPMYVAWGAHYIQLYNDGYRPILGMTKHPAAMGQAASQCFRESWDIIGPMFDGVMTGKAVGAEDWLLPLDRNGYLEECYFTFSYSPIREEAGTVGGVLVTVTETTGRVLGERRLRTLRDVAARTLGAATADEACRAAGEAIEANSADLPFALVYLLEDGLARAVTQVGMDPSSRVSPERISLQEEDPAWPLSKALRQPLLVKELGTRFGELPRAADTALVLPLTSRSGEAPAGFLVAGINPKRAFDDDYRSFLELVASNLSTAVASATAREEERRRASALAELNRAKSTFFSNVSHEFRTPLTLMLAPIQDMLASAPDEPVDRSALHLLQRNSLRLLKLVNTLLEFSRIEAGRVEALFEQVDLAVLTAELANGFQVAVERAGLQFIVDCPPLVAPVYIDRDMWEKIVFNLLSNALKSTFDGSIAVRLRDAQDDGVVLQVMDTGVGMEEAHLPHVFERFFRIEGAKSRSHEGSGIGLALVQELARLHGGEVAVTSRAGRGTTFSVSIPRGTARQSRERTRTLSETAMGSEPYVQEALRWVAPGPEAPPSVRRAASAGEELRARIVVADDNADMREYVTRILGERWDIEAVGDGAAALASIRRELPALVLCDVMMPTLDGFEVVRAMRADPDLRSIPVIFLSARADESCAAQGLSLGANDYISKPFSSRELLVRVASHLAAAHAAENHRIAEEVQRANLYRHFMQAPFPVAVFKGPNHVVELANPSVLQAWGKTPEILGLPLAEGFPELRGQPFLGWLEGVYQTGVTYEGREELARLPTGQGGALEDVYCNFVYAPLRDTRGAVEGILLSAFLVTDQVRARQALERALERAESSEAHIRDLVNNLPELAWNAQPDGHIDFYNQRWYEYTGTAFDDVQGWGWASVHDPKILPEVMDRWKDSLAKGVPFEMEFPLRRADGIYRWFLTRAIPLRDSGGTIVRWFGTSTDVDEARGERRRAEELAAELALASQALMAAKRAARIGIFDWDLPAGRVTWSPEIYWLLGLESDAIEATADAWTAAMLEEDREVGWNAYRKATGAKESTMETEIRLKQPTGDARWVRISSQIDYDADGIPSRVLGAVVDIQALKETAAERTRALLEAERTSRAKDEFLATMSHELRTPLNAMLGWSKILRGDLQDRKKLVRGLEVIERNAETQARLISDLLDVSRIISGKLRLSIQRVDVTTVLQAAVDVVRQAADAKRIHLVLNADPAVGALLGDPDRLQQIVWNLLINAIKFTPAKGTVTLTARRFDSSMCIQVDDTGAGISQADLPHIFERFRQVDSSSTRSHGGLGLGLAIVRHLCEAHGGTVEAQSDGPGKGTSFAVVLPIRAVWQGDEAKDDSSEEMSPPAGWLAPADQRLQGVRILVVDDDQDSLDLIGVVLEQAGASFVPANNATIAIQAFHAERFHLVISDIGMPGMDGYALMRSLRLHTDVPAIALTAYARAEDAESAVKAGYQRHFPKPVHAAELLVTIERMLRRDAL